MVHDMLFFILFYFISFCGNDIISDINLKYTFYKFAIMCVNYLPFCKKIKHLY